MNGGSKSLVLLYHVYNAADKDGDQIHDWERVEIVIHGISGTPGAGSEYVNHVTVTLHKEHHMRRYYDWELNFMQTATGKHVLLWQADESNWTTEENPRTRAALRHELVRLDRQSEPPARTPRWTSPVTDGQKNVHYVFVPEGSSAAVARGAPSPWYHNASTSRAA